jgi:O-acetyl-ADP-ribose deacetylase (regulator of RNase III)
MPIEEIKGDLFENTDEISLAHCVSADMKMGKGIAVLFRNRFGNIDRLLDLRKKPEDVAILYESKEGTINGVDVDAISEDKLVEIKGNANRYIFNLITKKKYWDKPTLKSMKNTLVKLYEICKILDVEEIAMPRIGCGLDLLDWADVSKLIDDIFVDVDVRVYIL